MEYLNMEFAGMNQRMSGKPPFYRWEEVSILDQKYRFRVSDCPAPYANPHSKK
jgi:hypothetical protein